MNIAVLIDQEIQSGGGFQHVLSTILLLNEKRCKDYNFIFFTTIKENISILKEFNINLKLIKISLVDKIINHFRRIEIFFKATKRVRILPCSKFDRVLFTYSIDLVYFLSPSPFSLDTEFHNYIFSVWDLSHRDFVEFPEVRVFREFEQREYLYKSAIPKAIAVIVDSELGKQNLIRRYGIDKGRVAVLPFLPSILACISESEYEGGFVDIKKKYGINGEYIFYPAQFWPHKNHIYILEGLKILKEKFNKKINAVFSGSDKGNLGFILKKTKELGLENQIYYIGFVDNQEMPYLYKQALALAMPTYFGPTNIPPLEAFKLGCPVLYSDLPGLEDQVKGAALLLDLKDPESLAKNLLKIIENSADIPTLVLNGKRKVEGWTEKDYWDRLKEILDAYSIKLKCWKQ